MAADPTHIFARLHEARGPRRRSIACEVAAHLNPQALKAPISMLISGISQHFHPETESQRKMTSLDDLPAEILEQVLLALPMRDMLLAQGVCQRWRSMIQMSSRLQTALFLRPSKAFEPVGDDEVCELLRAGKVNDAVAMKAVKSNPPDTPKWMLQPNWMMVSSRPGSAVTMNALLESRFESFLPITAMRSEYLTHISVLADVWEPTEIKTIPASFLYPEASWRKMFVTQSPSVTGSFDVCGAEPPADEDEGFVVKFGGIRLGDLITEAALARAGMLPEVTAQ